MLECVEFEARYESLMNGLSNNSGVPLSAASGFPASGQTWPGAIPQPGPATQVGFWLLALSLLIAYSRFFDMFATGYHIPAVVSVLLLFAILVSGAIPRAWRRQ